MAAQLLVLLLLFQPSAVQTQYVDDYKKVVDAYKAAPSISYTVLFKSFDSNTQKPDTTLRGRYMCKGSQFYNKIGTAETYKSSKYFLSVDNYNKVMFLNRSTAMDMDNTPAKMVDSVMAKFKYKVTSIDIDNGNTRRYTMEYPMSDDIMGKLILEFNKKTYLISRFVLYMPPQTDLYNTGKVDMSFRPFVEFIYSDYNFTPIPDGTFSVDKFITVQGKDIKLKEAYQKYQLVNSIFLNSPNR